MTAPRLIAPCFGIGSSGSGPSPILRRGAVSFSKIFWQQLRNGSSFRSAFRLASEGIKFSNHQTPVLDDDGDLMPNGLTDGFVAARFVLGSGVLLAGDAPIVAQISVNTALVSDFEQIAVSKVTTTGVIQEVFAVVTQPDGKIVTQDLPANGDSYLDRSYALCGPVGDYEIAVFAIDEEDNTSAPATAVANRATACTDFMFVSGFE